MDDFDDIPVAVRDTPSLQAPVLQKRLFWIAGISAGVVGLLAGAIAATLPAPKLSGKPTLVTPSTLKSTTLTPPNLAPPTLDPSATPSGNPSSDAASPVSPKDIILGHYAYAEADPASLVEIAPGIQLSKAAATAYEEMVEAARNDGVSLVPLSGFRSKQDQEHLFFEVKQARGQTATERAKVSAPPGHSEHHTGYAIDLGDANAAGTNLSQSFETTQAFQWLQDNAAFYSFELSFPKDNAQGVSYEPWHWRFVGNQDSLELFHRGTKGKG